MMTKRMPLILIELFLMAMHRYMISKNTLNSEAFIVYFDVMPCNGRRPSGISYTNSFTNYYRC